MVVVWIAGTALAMALATLAVQIAGAKVTTRPAATVSRSQIETEIARDRSTTTAATAAGGSVPGDVAGPAAGADTSSPAAPGAPPSAPGPSPTTAPPSTATPRATTTAPAPTGGRAPTTVAAGVPPPPPPTSAPRPDPTTSPTTAPVTTVPVSEQTFVLTGGSVRVRCTGTTAQRLSSSPAPGYAMDIRSSGPQLVEVRFDAASHRSELKATCSAGGAITAEPREEDHGGSGGGTPGPS